MRYFLFGILFSITIITYGQGKYGCNCRNEILYYIEMPPEQPLEKFYFKGLLSTKLDTSNFAKGDTGSLVVKFYINKCGDLKSVKTLYDNYYASKEIKKALPKLGKWRAGDNGGKVCCVYVALKFEFTGSAWHVKRLDPYTLEEKGKFYFHE